ncbi:thymosin beta-4-like [Microcebus murinus]|nr:thymosin beta-4-like [Microcebus murinus]
MSDEPKMTKMEKFHKLKLSKTERQVRNPLPSKETME